MDSICSAVPYSRLLCSMGVWCPRGGCNDPLNCSIVTRTILVGTTYFQFKEKDQKSRYSLPYQEFTEVHTFITDFLTAQDPQPVVSALYLITRATYNHEVILHEIICFLCRFPEFRQPDGFHVSSDKLQLGWSQSLHQLGIAVFTKRLGFIILHGCPLKQETAQVYRVSFHPWVFT